MSHPGLVSLPNELLFQIVSYLPQERDINALTLCSHRLYTLFNTYLYLHNIQHNQSNALLWSCEHGHESTLRRLLDLGADIQVKTGPEYTYTLQNESYSTSLNGLYLACLNGHPHIARMLLEEGINENEHARKREAMPLYYALRQRHDNVALALLEHFSDTNCQLNWTASHSTPLHLASNLGLPKLVRFLLKKGANVKVEDADGMTAIHYAMLGHSSSCKGCFGKSFFGMVKSVGFESKVETEAEAEEVEEGDGRLEVIRMLLESGADMDFKIKNRDWRHRHSARELARRHPDAEVRKLFGVDGGGWLGRVVEWKRWP